MSISDQRDKYGIPVIDVILDAWDKDIDPENVVAVLNSEGIEVDVDTVRKLYQAWYTSETYPYLVQN